jgi:hypothetical protein
MESSCEHGKEPSGVAGQLVASQEELSSMELLNASW